MKTFAELTVGDKWYSSPINENYEEIFTVINTSWYGGEIHITSRYNRKDHTERNRYVPSTTNLILSMHEANETIWGRNYTDTSLREIAIAKHMRDVNRMIRNRELEKRRNG